MQVTRCLTKQPGNVSHLELRGLGPFQDVLGTGRLIELRCAAGLACSAACC